MMKLLGQVVPHLLSTKHLQHPHDHSTVNNKVHCTVFVSGIHTQQLEKYYIHAFVAVCSLSGKHCFAMFSDWTLSIFEKQIHQVSRDNIELINSKCFLKFIKCA